MINDILNYTLFEVGEYTFRVAILFRLIALFFGVTFILAIIKRLINKADSIHEGKKFSILKLVQYIVVTFAFFFALNILGFDITVFWATSAALFVGLGFGLQHLFNDFISGVILLLDGTLKVNDIIEVNDKIYHVQEINFRTTTVIGRQENYVIVPNSELTGNKVINWTYNKVSSRFHVEIGVDYSSDIHLVMDVMKSAASKHPQILQTPPPFVRFTDCADSALLFSVFFFSDEVFRIENVKSDLRILIFEEFKKRNITIPFPQRVIHMANKE